MSGRTYDAPRRRARAEATRRSVLDAARQLFAARGIEDTTVSAIAEQAGVSVQTVYATYRSKAGLLVALIDDLERTVDASRHLERIDSAGSALEQLRLIVTFHSEMFDQALEMIDLARKSRSDPDVRAFFEEGEGRRRIQCQHWVQRWQYMGALRSDIDPRTAVDLLWAHCGPDVYATFAVSCDWEPERVQHWVTRALAVLLLDETSS